MEEKNRISQKQNAGRIKMMLAGILLIGMGVASYRLSLFGADPFTCQNLGISGFIGMSFGNWQLIMNLLILVVVFFQVRNCIGLGTVVNMVCVGYIADFLCWLARDVLGLGTGILLRLLFLCAGTLLASFGCALYMTANLGIAPYDSVAFIITKLTENRVSFRMARIFSDVFVMFIGVAFCLAAHHNVWEIIGLGTIINALCNGPMIQFFRAKMERTTKKAGRKEKFC